MSVLFGTHAVTVEAEDALAQGKSSASRHSDSSWRPGFLKYILDPEESVGIANIRRDGL